MSIITGFVPHTIFDNPIIRIIVRIITFLVLIGVVWIILPEIPIPPEFIIALKGLFSNLWRFDFMISVSTLFTAFSLIIMTDVILITLKIIIWIHANFMKKGG